MSTKDLTLDAALDRVIRQYGQHFALGSIIECFSASVRDLRAIGVGAGLVHAAESMTGARLRNRLARPAEVA